MLFYTIYTDFSLYEKFTSTCVILQSILEGPDNLGDSAWLYMMAFIQVTDHVMIQFGYLDIQYTLGQS